MKLTKAQKKRYIEKNGKFCPFCCGREIFYHNWIADGWLRCGSCLGVWKEISRVVDIKTR